MALAVKFIHSILLSFMSQYAHLNNETDIAYNIFYKSFNTNFLHKHSFVYTQRTKPLITKLPTHEEISKHKRLAQYTFKTLFNCILTAFN